MRLEKFINEGISDTTRQLLMKKSKMFVDKKDWPENQNLQIVVKGKDRITSVIRDTKVGNFYIHTMGELYGPFKTKDEAKDFFKDVIYKSDTLMRQIQVNDWAGEGKKFLTPANANI